jgi:phage replication O-like protein O
MGRECEMGYNRLTSKKSPPYPERILGGFLFKVESLPYYTKIPNVVIDILMRKLSGSELKIVLVVIRKTIGWGKKWDRISYSQFEDLTGMGLNTVIRAIKSVGMGGKKIIYQKKIMNGYLYQLNKETLSKMGIVVTERSISKMGTTKENKRKDYLNDEFKDFIL